MASSTTTSSLVVLFQTLVAMLIVDSSGFGGGEGIVGFGYLDEFVVGRVIARVLIRMVLF